MHNHGICLGMHVDATVKLRCDVRLRHYSKTSTSITGMDCEILTKRGKIGELRIRLVREGGTASPSACSRHLSAAYARRGVDTQGPRPQAFEMPKVQWTVEEVRRDDLRLDQLSGGKARLSKRTQPEE